MGQGEGSPLAGEGMALREANAERGRAAQVQGHPSPKGQKAEKWPSGTLPFLFWKESRKNKKQALSK